MAAHARLKNEFRKKEKCRNLMSRFIFYNGNLPHQANDNFNSVIHIHDSNALVHLFFSLFSVCTEQLWCTLMLSILTKSIFVQSIWAPSSEFVSSSIPSWQTLTAHAQSILTMSIFVQSIWAPSSEFVSSSIPSWQTLTAHAQSFRGARDLAFCLKVPLDSLLVWASSEGSGETAGMRRLARTFTAHSYKQWVKRNLQAESQIPGPSELLGMRS